ncbi:MAG: endonuclease domain-containing protein [Lysobacter sp.]|nr:endonuclease domain-containing protein [Lysobacter sp.]
MTDAERTLWRHLRNRELTGFKFRRQHPVGRYIVDFICLELGLVVELDGGQHADSPLDAVRTSTLQQQGYLVLRFWNNEVLIQTDAVLAAILDAGSARCPHPSPLPRPEGSPLGG